MFNPFKYIETILYKVRDSFWSLPNIIFDDSIYKRNFIRVYKTASPYSHFATAIIFLILLLIFLFLGSFPKIFGSTSNRLIEGVVVGVDDNGDIQRINKVNPLLPSNIQLEKDLVELVYEPLLRYELIDKGDGTYVAGTKPILAEEIIRIRQGSDYQFNLRTGVLWHDGIEFSADDVIKTFEIISNLNVQNAYVQAIKQLRWEKVDKYSVRVCTKGIDETLPCDGSETRPVLSNFLVLISVKIIPEHLSSDINEQTISSSNASLFRTPIGTGPYRFESVEPNSILLKRNEKYYNPVIGGNIDEINFIFYESLENAVEALESGEVHTLASLSVQYKTELESFPNINTNVSPVLDNQFWGLYFNLKTKPDGTSFAPAFLSDVKVRQAISASINRTNVINEALKEVGKEAFGPITSKSFFFNPNAGWYTNDVSKSTKLLDEAGWTLKPGNKYRTNSKGESLTFSLYYVDSYDRRKVAEEIKSELSKVGIEAIIDRREQPGQDSSTDAPNGWTLKELNDQILAPRLFDVMLYGMNTFIDPDRYELYHSSQQQSPGLNIAAYIGSEETVVAKTAEERAVDPSSSVKRVSKVDRILEQTRTFDPEEARDIRKQNYDEFQTLLASDAPVVFLYNPQFLYFSHGEVKNINLDEVISIEDRFRNVGQWVIE